MQLESGICLEEQYSACTKKDRAFEQKLYTDLAIKCSTETFNVHRSIVAPQSGFLQKCLSTDFIVRIPKEHPSINELTIDTRSQILRRSILGMTSL